MLDLSIVCCMFTRGYPLKIIETTPFITLASLNQWEFQDPKMEVLYHIRADFLGIFPYIGLI